MIIEPQNEAFGLRFHPLIIPSKDTGKSQVEVSWRSITTQTQLLIILAC